MVASSVAFTMCPHLCSQFYMPAVPKETWTHFPTLGASASVCPSFLFLDQNLGNLEEPCVKYATCSWTSVHSGNMCSFVSLPCSGIPIESSLLEDTALLPKPHPSWMLSEEPSVDLTIPTGSLFLSSPHLHGHSFPTNSNAVCNSCCSGLWLFFCRLRAALHVFAPLHNRPNRPQICSSTVPPELLSASHTSFLFSLPPSFW